MKHHTQKAANYTDHGKRNFCKDCWKFIPPDACKYVEGVIKPMGHCKFFERKSLKHYVKGQNDAS